MEEQQPRGQTSWVGFWCPLATHYSLELCFLFCNMVLATVIVFFGGHIKQLGCGTGTRLASLMALLTVSSFLRGFEVEDSLTTLDWNTCIKGAVPQSCCHLLRAGRPCWHLMGYRISKHALIFFRSTKGHGKSSQSHQ